MPGDFYTASRILLALVMLALLAAGATTAALFATG
jgi:hypothetical protein